MTNKFYNETAALSVYIANLDEYVKGTLMGDWVSLPIEENDWKDFLKTIGNPEEIAIHDYENNLGLDGLKIGEYMSIKELNELGERIECIELCKVNTFNAIFEVLGYFEDALECLESDDYVYYGCITMEEVAQKFLEGAHAIPIYFKKHIDYKSIARDMLNNGYYITDYGVIEIL